MDFSRDRRRLFFQVIPLLFLVIAIVVGGANITIIRQYLIGALGDEANIVINVTESQGTLKRPWRNLAQGGESKDWKLAPIAGQVKALNTEYIRLDHIYDFYDIVKNNGGQLSFDFTKLTEIIKEIQSTGAKPYISLSYTPPALAVNGDITAPPANIADWQLTVQRTIEHVSGTMGIEGVYYEVWNEPDLFGGYKVYGDRNYMNLYAAAARGAAQAKGVKPFKFGGPAVTALYKNWLDAIAKSSIENNYRFDFFSWHRYDRDINVFRNDVAVVRGWLAAYPQLADIELHITEWGHDSRNDPGYDGNFGAIHTIAVSTELPEMVDRAFVFEVQDGKDPAGQVRWGRWGIIDSSGQAKPRYQALRFLDKLGTERIRLLGRGTWVKGIAARDANSVSAIIVNYDPNGRHTETAPVTFTNITPGSYSLEKQTFGGAPAKTQLATTSSELRIDIPLSANSAVFLKLTPLDGTLPPATIQQEIPQESPTPEPTPETPAQSLRDLISQ